MTAAVLPTLGNKSWTSSFLGRDKWTGMLIRWLNHSAWQIHLEKCMTRGQQDTVLPGRFYLERNWRFEMPIKNMWCAVTPGQPEREMCPDPGWLCLNTDWTRGWRMACEQRRWWAGWRPGRQVMLVPQEGMHFFPSRNPCDANYLGPHKIREQSGN